MRRSSIAWRLAIGLSIMVAVLWLGAATIAGLVMQRELDSAFDELLEQAAYRLLPLGVKDALILGLAAAVVALAGRVAGRW